MLLYIFILSCWEIVWLHIFILFICRKLCYGTLYDSHRLERGNTCSEILLCKDITIKLWQMWSSKSSLVPLLTDVSMAQWGYGGHPASCLMPRWLQAEVWDVLTALELRYKLETVVRNNGAGAASSGNMHKYVHRMAHHAHNKPYSLLLRS